MTLDSLLIEVGPILASSQFSHPSFREVLTARQFADEINSGRLSVKSATYSLWLYDSYGDVLAAQDNSGYCDDLPYGCYFEPTGLKSEWSQVLAHMAGMLNEDKAKEFVDIVGEFHKDKISSIMHKPSIHGRSVVLEDFALCAKFIGRYQTSVSPEGHEKQIIDALLSVAKKYTDGKESEWVNERARIALNALATTRSSYVARELVDYVAWCANVPGYENPIDDARLDSSAHSFNTILKLADAGVEVEDSLLSHLPNGNYGNYGSILSLLSVLGKSKSLETLIRNMPDEHSVVSAPYNNTERYLNAIFALFEKYEFNPDLIKTFNEQISKIGDGKFMYQYHEKLELRAYEMLKYRQVELYKLLEKNKMQFWDYWMVYEPSRIMQTLVKDRDEEHRLLDGV